MKNEIIEVEGGFKVTNGNAESQLFISQNDACIAMDADNAVSEEYETADEQEDHSPIDWHC